MKVILIAHIIFTAGGIFNSSERFLNYFDFKENVKKVTIDLSKAHFWDVSAVSSLDKAVIKFKKANIETVILGLNEASQTIIDRFSIGDDPEEMERALSGH